MSRCRKTQGCLAMGDRTKIQWADATWRDAVLEVLSNLRGKNFACWCGLCDEHADGRPFGTFCADCPPCHGDFLLLVANR